MQVAFSPSENISEYLPFGTELSFRDTLMKNTRKRHILRVVESREADGVVPGNTLRGSTNTCTTCYRVHRTKRPGRLDKDIFIELLLFSSKAVSE